MKKVFINPQTGKEWFIETDNLYFITCLNRGKIKEILCTTHYELKSKSGSTMMGQMRKGFIYRNPKAKFGEPLYHGYLNKDYNGFMPIATSFNSDDFYVTRLIGQFEDEILYHFNESLELLNKYHLGGNRLTSSHVLIPNGKLLLDNSYLIEIFDPILQQIESFDGLRDSFKNTMLDTKLNLTLWYNGKEIIVYDFLSDKEVFRESIQFEKTGMTYTSDFFIGMLSPKATKLVYRVTKDGYTILDLSLGTKLFISSEDWHPFFSPDDSFVCIGGQIYSCQNGEIVRENSFPFSIPKNLTYNDTCNVVSRDNLMVVQFGSGNSPIQLWDYKSKKLLTSIEDEFIVKNASYALTKNMLVVHTDYGALSIYNCNTSE